VKFSLIDRVLEHEKGVKLRGLKAVTSAEEYLGDHFPGFPVLPGVMMLEALVQAGRLLAADLEDVEAPDRLILSQARNVRYASFVTPGRCLEVEVILKKREDANLILQGIATVEGQTAVQAKLTLTPASAMV